jgi:hypothetical protein
MGEKRKAYKIFIVMPEENRPLIRARRRGWVILKWILVR